MLQAQKERDVAAQDCSRRILFVCTGNTCRSPMAAALMHDAQRPREQGESEPALAVIAESAGLMARDGDPITPTAVQALEQAGVVACRENDYPAHRARLVTREMIEAADSVVGITSRHALELIMRFPEHAAKITAFPLEIADPYGGDLELYRECLAQLRYGIALLLATEGKA